jgi:predicted lipid carrier protein YhbT
MTHPLESPIMHLSDLLQVPVVLIPLPLTEALANLAYQRVLAKHPLLFDRLEGYRDRRFGFFPTDIPLAFFAKPSNGRIEVRRKPFARDDVDVSVEAPFSVLLELLQGSADGDALFFSRDVQVEGDMEALLALRNSLDAACVDLVGDVLATVGPLAPMLRAVLGHAATWQSKEAGRWS